MHAPLPPSKGSRPVLFRVQTFFGTSCQQSKAAEKQTIIGNKNISHKRKQTSHKTQISSWIVGGEGNYDHLGGPHGGLGRPPHFQRPKRPTAYLDPTTPSPLGQNQEPQRKTC